MIKIKMKKSFVETPIYFLILAMPLATITVLILTPALQQLAQHFSISLEKSSNAITIAMLGYAIGPIIYGPIAKQYGQKNSFYVGLIISFIGLSICIGSFFYGNFFGLLLGRFLTSLGAVSGMVISYAIVANYYNEITARKILSILTILAFAVMPALAITASGYIIQYLNFVYCFYFLIPYSILCAYSIFIFNNDLDIAKKSINFQDILSGYYNLIKNKIYMGYIAVAGISVGSIYIYAAKAPIIAASQIQLTPEQFGHYNLIPYLGYVASLFISSKFSHRISYNKIIRYGILMMMIGIALIFLSSLLNVLNPYLLFFGAFIIFCGSAPIVPNSIVLATQSINDRGFAASFGSFFYMVLAALFTWLSNILKTVPSLSYVISIIGLVFLMFVINYFILGKKS